MSDTPTPDPFKAFADFMDSVAVILEHTSAYRAQCIEAGFSETAAEQMAVDWHRCILARTLTPKTPT